MSELVAARRDCGEPIRFRLADGEIAGRRWGPRGAPRVLFCHATGFCASAYRRVLAPLAERFDVIALDLRGHGRSALPADAKRLKSWSPFVRDIGAVLDHLAAPGEGPVLLAGHSFGGACVLMAARGRRDVSGLALIEPVIVSRLIALAAATPAWPAIAARVPVVRGALARRASWPDRAAARAAYGRKSLFSTWAEGCLDDYLEDGLVSDPAGVALACAPAWEAAVFAAQANRPWPAAAAAPAPISVLVAHKGSTVSQAARRRLRRLGAEVEVAPGATHLLPFENPELAARFIANARTKSVG